MEEAGCLSSAGPITANVVSGPPLWKSKLNSGENNRSRKNRDARYPRGAQRQGQPLLELETQTEDREAQGWRGKVQNRWRGRDAEERQRCALEERTTDGAGGRDGLGRAAAGAAPRGLSLARARRRTRSLCPGLQRIPAGRQRPLPPPERRAAAERPLAVQRGLRPRGDRDREGTETEREPRGREGSSASRHQRHGPNPSLYRCSPRDCLSQALCLRALSRAWEQPEYWGRPGMGLPPQETPFSPGPPSRLGRTRMPGGHKPLRREFSREAGEARCSPAQPCPVSRPFERSQKIHICLGTAHNSIAFQNSAGRKMGLAHQQPAGTLPASSWTLLQILGAWPH